MQHPFVNFLCQSGSVLLGHQAGDFPYESLHTKSDNFLCGNFDIFRHVCTFHGAVVRVASALAWAATSSTLTHLAEEILGIEKQQKWRRPQFGAKFLFCASVFFRKFVQVISTVRYAVRTFIQSKTSSTTVGENMKVFPACQRHQRH